MLDSQLNILAGGQLTVFDCILHTAEALHPAAVHCCKHPYMVDDLLAVQGRSESYMHRTAILHTGCIPSGADEPKILGKADGKQERTAELMMIRMILPDGDVVLAVRTTLGEVGGKQAATRSKQCRGKIGVVAHQGEVAADRSHVPAGEGPTGQGGFLEPPGNERRCNQLLQCHHAADA